MNGLRSVAGCILSSSHGGCGSLRFKLPDPEQTLPEVEGWRTPIWTCQQIHPWCIIHSIYVCIFNHVHKFALISCFFLVNNIWSNEYLHNDRHDMHLLKKQKADTHSLQKAKHQKGHTNAQTKWDEVWSNLWLNHFLRRFNQLTSFDNLFIPQDLIWERGILSHDSWLLGHCAALISMLQSWWSKYGTGPVACHWQSLNCTTMLTILSFTNTSSWASDPKFWIDLKIPILSMNW